jgi:hypothetical protein
MRGPEGEAAEWRGGLRGILLLFAGKFGAQLAHRSGRLRCAKGMSIKFKALLQKVCARRATTELSILDLDGVLWLEHRYRFLPIAFVTVGIGGGGRGSQKAAAAAAEADASCKGSLPGRDVYCCCCCCARNCGGCILPPSGVGGVANEKQG